MSWKLPYMAVLSFHVAYTNYNASCTGRIVHNDTRSVTYSWDYISTRRRFRSFPFCWDSIASRFRLQFSCIVCYPFSVPYTLLMMSTCNQSMWTLLLGLMNGAILHSHHLHRQLSMLNCTHLLPLLWKFKWDRTDWRCCYGWSIERSSRTRLIWITMVLSDRLT